MKLSSKIFKVFLCIIVTSLWMPHDNTYYTKARNIPTKTFAISDPEGNGRTRYGMSKINDQQVLITGGGYLSGSGANYPTPDRWILNVETGKTEKLENMPINILFHDQSYIRDGEVTFSGGRNYFSQPTLSRMVRIYSSTENEITKTINLPDNWGSYNNIVTETGKIIAYKPTPNTSDSYDGTKRMDRFIIYDLKEERFNYDLKLPEEITKADSYLRMNLVPLEDDKFMVITDNVGMFLYDPNISNELIPWGGGNVPPIELRLIYSNAHYVGNNKIIFSYGYRTSTYKEYLDLYVYDYWEDTWITLSKEEIGIDLCYYYCSTRKTELVGNKLVFFNGQSGTIIDLSFFKELGFNQPPEIRLN